MAEEARIRGELAKIAKRPENALCADCGTRGPTWASFNLGIFICMSCSGVHRSMGVHISKVRSIHLDKWELKGVETMSQMGNHKSNAVYEASMPANEKINEFSESRNRETFIRTKYERRSWMPKAAPNALPLPESKPAPVVIASPSPQAAAPAAAAAAADPLGLFMGLSIGSASPVLVSPSVKSATPVAVASVAVAPPPVRLARNQQASPWVKKPGQEAAPSVATAVSPSAVLSAASSASSASSAASMSSMSSDFDLFTHMLVSPPSQSPVAVSPMPDSTTSTSDFDLFAGMLSSPASHSISTLIPNPTPSASDSAAQTSVSQISQIDLFSGMNYAPEHGSVSSSAFAFLSDPVPTDTSTSGGLGAFSFLSEAPLLPVSTSNSSSKSALRVDALDALFGGEDAPLPMVSVSLNQHAFPSQTSQISQTSQTSQQPAVDFGFFSSQAPARPVAEPPVSVDPFAALSF